MEGPLEASQVIWSSPAVLSNLGAHAKESAKGGILPGVKMER